MDGSAALDPRQAAPRRPELLALFAFFLVLIVFGVIVEIRSRYSKRARAT